MARFIVPPMPAAEDGGPRFYALDPDPDVPSHPLNLGDGWVGVVDTEAGGVIAWTHESRWVDVWVGVFIMERGTE